MIEVKDKLSHEASSSIDAAAEFRHIQITDETPHVALLKLIDPEILAAFLQSHSSRASYLDLSSDMPLRESDFLYKTALSIEAKGKGLILSVTQPAYCAYEKGPGYEKGVHIFEFTDIRNLSEVNYSFMLLNHVGQPISGSHHTDILTRMRLGDAVGSIFRLYSEVAYPSVTGNSYPHATTPWEPSRKEENR